MIEKFNFYDLYGYLLPGLALLGLMWLPFGVVERFWPAQELSSALAALGFAYIIGHLLQTLAVNAIPSGVRSRDGRLRFPSDLILDSTDPTFSAEFKKELAGHVKSELRIDLEVNGASNAEISKKRQDAFFLCRGILIREVAVSYAEQFEGMYALMRGLATAFWLGFIYLAGWGVSLFQHEWAGVAAVGTALGAMAITVGMGIAVWALGSHSCHRFAVDRVSVAALTLALFAVGYRLGWGRVVSGIQSTMLSLLSVAALFASIRFLAAYSYFAQEFAKAIWRGFAAHPVARSPSDHKGPR